MKILFLSGWFPYPPNNGSRIRIYNFIKNLARKHEVFLVSLLQADSHPEDAKMLVDICRVVSLHRVKDFDPKSVSSFLGFLSTRPRSNFATYDPRVKVAVQDAIAQIRPDVIVASTLDVVEYLPAQRGIPSVLIDHNCEFGMIKRNTEFIANRLAKWRYTLSWQKSARWEAQICRQFDAVVMPTEEDKKLMTDFYPWVTNISVIPNGADTDAFDPNFWAPEPNRLIYNGSLTYDANLDAIEYYLREIYPHVAAALPEVKLVVTGRTDGVDLGIVGRSQGVMLSGYVDDIRKELYRSAACVIPLRKGGGMRLKIPEAMAAGVPVVSTSMGAEGLDCVDQEHLLIADTPVEFAGAVVRLLTDEALSRRLRQNARALIERRYSWHTICGQFTDLVEEVAARK